LFSTIKMENKFWTEDLTMLFRGMAILPNGSMTDVEKLNALTRLVIIVTIVLYLLKNRHCWTFLVVGLVVIITLYYTRTTTVENFTPDRFGCNMPRSAAITPIVVPHIYGNSWYNAQFPTFGHQDLTTNPYGAGNSAPHPFDFADVPNHQSVTHMEVADAFGGYSAPLDRGSGYSPQSYGYVHNAFENYPMPRMSDCPVYHQNLGQNIPAFQTQTQVENFSPLMGYSSGYATPQGHIYPDQSGQMVDYGSELDYPSNAPVLNNIPPGSMFSDDVYNYYNDVGGFNEDTYDEPFFQPYSREWQGIDYLARSNVDHISEITPLDMFQANTNPGMYQAREVAEDAYTTSALQFRGSMMNQFIAKKENERKARRCHPIQRGSRR